MHCGECRPTPTVHQSYRYVLWGVPSYSYSTPVIWICTVGSAVLLLQYTSHMDMHCGECRPTPTVHQSYGYALWGVPSYSYSTPVIWICTVGSAVLLLQYTSHMDMHCGECRPTPTVHQSYGYVLWGVPSYSYSTPVMWICTVGSAVLLLQYTSHMDMYCGECRPTPTVHQSYGYVLWGVPSYSYSTPVIWICTVGSAVLLLQYTSHMDMYCGECRPTPTVHQSYGYVLWGVPSYSYSTPVIWICTVGSAVLLLQYTSHIDMY